MLDSPDLWNRLGSVLNLGGWAALLASAIQLANLYLRRKQPAAEVLSTEAVADKVREESHSVGVDTLLKIIRQAQDEIERAAKRHREEIDRYKEEAGNLRLQAGRCEDENRALKQQNELLREMKNVQ